MRIYPAIDLRGGQVVRLKEGDPQQQTVFSSDPVATAREWLAAGAQWLHMVNLDGAFGQQNDNARILEQVAALGLRVQFGGGLRSLEAAEQALAQGASRVVLGTAAVENPALIEQAVARFGTEAVCIALDARDGQIATHGWQQKSGHTPEEFAHLIREMGVRYALYTDVSRDGGLAGANVEATIALGRSSGLQVIASGGVSSTDEIRRLARSEVVHGAVIGMALYQGRLSLKEALEAAEEGRDAG